MSGERQFERALSTGRTAEIYPWQEGQVIKLFREWVPASWAEAEARIAHLVQSTGLPVPAFEQVVSVQGRMGLVYERVDGPAMSSLLESRRWRLTFFAHQLARLHAQLHACVATGFPSQKEVLVRKISSADALPEHLKDAVLRRLQSLPVGDRLCHGDFHLGNILQTRRGPVIIDWPDATRGHPLADVARTVILTRNGGRSTRAVVARLDDLFRERFCQIYLRHYFQLTSESTNQLDCWLPVVAAARLSEDIREEEDRLLAFARQGLAS